VDRQRFRLRPNLVRQLAELEVGRRQRLAGLRVGLPGQQLLQVGVEAGRLFQQLRPQLLELGVLEQRVLADAGVEQRDRLLG
jgi:hypothetical protein